MEDVYKYPTNLEADLYHNYSFDRFDKNTVVMET